MEEIQKKLSTLNYPRANAPAQSLLFAGMERYALLEWLFFRYALISHLLFFANIRQIFQLRTSNHSNCISEPLISPFLEFEA